MYLHIVMTSKAQPHEVAPFSLSPFAPRNDVVWRCPLNRSTPSARRIFRGYPPGQCVLLMGQPLRWLIYLTSPTLRHPFALFAGDAARPSIANGNGENKTFAIPLLSSGVADTERRRPRHGSYLHCSCAAMRCQAWCYPLCPFPCPLSNSVLQRT